MRLRNPFTNILHWLILLDLHRQAEGGLRNQANKIHASQRGAPFIMCGIAPKISRADVR